MMNIKYSKTFTYFEDGIKELVKIVPELRDYIGDSNDRKEVLNYILDLFKEDLPYIGNTDTSNLSITLDQQSLVFLMDNGMSFSFYIQTETHDYNIIVTGFELIFGYSNPYMNKRRMKRIQEGFKENEWHEEENNISRNFDREEVIEKEETTTKEDTNVQNIPNKNYQDYTEAVPLPTFIQDDEEPIQEEATALDSELTLNNQYEKQYIPPNNGLDRFKRNAGQYAALIKYPLDPIDIANKYRSLKEFYNSSDFRDNMDYWYTNNQPTEALQNIENLIVYQEQQSLQEEPIQEVQEVDARKIPSRLKGIQRPLILPNGKVSEETKHLQESFPTHNGLEELDPAFFAIRPTQDPSTVIIRHEGREFPCNVNEQTAGIIRDPANKKLTIDYAVYDYGIFRAYKLPDNFAPDSATYIEGTENMRPSQQIPDEAFVPRETILKNADINIDAIQEEAIKRERFKEKMTGVKSPVLWNKETVPVPQQPSSNVLKKGRSFVIDSPKVEYTDKLQGQSVQIMNDDYRY